MVIRSTRFFYMSKNPLGIDMIRVYVDRIDMNVTASENSGRNWRRIP